MLLLCALSGEAAAARVFYTAPLTEAEEEAVRRTVADARLQPAAELMTGGEPLPAADDDALKRLAAELAAARPLLDEFDGELQIMSRLSKATSDVHRLRTPQERDLLISALLFAGFAVDRYFQDKLGSDPAAAPYRDQPAGSQTVGGQVRILAWMDAAALYNAPAPPPDALPEPAQRLAYDSLQAWQRSMPSASFVVGALAAGAELFIDGERITVAAGTRVPVIPGRHLWHVTAGGIDLLRSDRRVEPAADIRILAPVGPVELEVLRQLGQSGSDGWQVPEPVMLQVAALAEPTYLALHRDGERLRLLRLDSGRAAHVRLIEESARWAGRVVAGLGWANNDDWLLQHLGEPGESGGAPVDVSTVNALTADLGIGGEFRPLPMLAVGAGIDLLIPAGDWHTLPIGSVDGSNREQRLLAYPHAAVGLPWLQATAGPLLPWHAGFGLQAQAPIFGPVGLRAAALYGLPVDRPREDGSAFAPAPWWSAGGGLVVQWPGRR